MSNSIRTLVASVVTVLFSISLFDALFNLNKVIVPGESIILLTAGLVVLLVFGRGRLGGKEE